jgi:hypothetical protein
MKERRYSPRYEFVASVEMVDVESGMQIVSLTSNLSLYGCYVKTTTPFRAGTSIKVTITHGDTSFTSLGKVAFSVADQGVGIAFDTLTVEGREILRQWVNQVSAHSSALPYIPSASERATGSSQRMMFIVFGVVAVAAVATGMLAMLGLL